MVLYHRNPFDILATQARRSNLEAVTVEHIEWAFDHRVPTLERLRRELDPHECIELHHDDVLADPKAVLTNVIEAFEETASTSFLQDSTSILHESSNKSRNQITWPPDVVKLIEENMASYEPGFPIWTRKDGILAPVRALI